MIEQATANNHFQDAHLECGAHLHAGPRLQWQAVHGDRTVTPPGWGAIAAGTQLRLAGVGCLSGHRLLLDVLRLISLLVGVGLSSRRPRRWLRLCNSVGPASEADRPSAEQRTSQVLHWDLPAVSQAKAGAAQKMVPHVAQTAHDVRAACTRDRHLPSSDIGKLTSSTSGVMQHTSVTSNKATAEECTCLPSHRRLCPPSAPSQRPQPAPPCCAH